MTIVHQYNNFACFAACLESFLRDKNSDFDHEDFVKENLELFGGGSDIEGCPNSKDFSEICTRAGLACEQVVAGTPLDLGNCGVLLYVHWKNDEGQKHCVRLAGEKEQGRLMIMNPMNSNHIEEMPVSWVRAIFKITKIQSNAQCSTEGIPAIE